MTRGSSCFPVPFEIVGPHKGRDLPNANQTPLNERRGRACAVIGSMGLLL
jgi:hypothetical protein